MRRLAMPRLRSEGGLITSGMLLVGLLTLACALFIHHLHDRTIADSEINLSSLSTVLADQADRALQAIDLVEQSVLDEIAAADIVDPAALATQFSAQSFQLELKARILALPQVNAVTLIDDHGKLVNFSRYWPIPDINVADRDYFKELSGNPAKQRFVSRPVANRGDGTWTIYLARRLNGPDGRFLGSVLGAVDLHYFETLYSQISPQPDYAFALFGSGDVLLARYPARKSDIGRSFPAGGTARLVKSGLSHGVVRGVSVIDGDERLMAVRSLSHYPLRLVVSRMVDASLAPWRQQAAILGTAAILLDIGLIGLIVVGVRQLRQQVKLSQAVAARLEAEERARSERELREQYTRFETALDHMSQGLCMFDGDATLVVMNEQFARMYAIPPGLRARGTPLQQLIEHTRRAKGAGLSDPRTPDALGRPPEPVAFTIDLADGRSINVTRAPIPNGGWVCTHDDATERKAQQAEIAHLARHDVLTGLPNRFSLREYMEKVAVDASRSDKRAVLYLDLDGFKRVNDEFGHTTGDLLLCEVAQRLRACTRETDLICRLGGDEFAIVQDSGPQPQAAEALAKRLVETLRRPLELEGKEITIGTSVGVVLHEGDFDPAELLRSADIALYAAKAAGRGTWQFFDASMDTELQTRRALERDLRHAHAHELFEVFYQPLVRADTSTLLGFEALLRWHHPERGLVSPDEFIPAAEEMGLIRPIGAWVLARACADAVGWPEPMKVAVNLSPVQFAQGNLVDDVEQALSASGLPPHRLELEITESVLLADNDRTLAILHRLRGMGVRIAMDDFGTGYSSLSYLRRFPFDKIKMDQSFVRNLQRDSDGVAIIRAIIGLGRALRMDVLAEGVETEEQLGLLRGEGCDELQGYLFSRPVPLQIASAMVAATVDRDDDLVLDAHQDAGPVPSGP